MASFGGILDSLKALLSNILGAASRFFGSLFQAEVKIVDNLSRIVQAFDRTKESIQREIETLKNFEFDPKWKSRVINVPIAIDQVKKLVAMVTDDFKAKLLEIRAPIHDLYLIFHVDADANVPDVDKPSAIARAGVKIDEIATMISQLADAMETIEDFAELFEKVTTDLESLDELFLSQGSTKKTVEVTYKKRQRGGG